MVRVQIVSASVENLRSIFKFGKWESCGQPFHGVSFVYWI